MTDESTINALEDQLQSATLAGDADVLDVLLADDLTFIDHLGRRVDKQQELEAHRTGILKVHQMDVYDRIVRLLDKAAVVSLRARVGGTYYDEEFSTKAAFTRVWVCRHGIWSIISVHCCLVTM
ncbi:MAG: nuclear transport factor 2 family protein [Phyllobacterium sp.]|uniref:nuclear transport factor 2 family protein n=1 Tax=Phyllobacterium sp. TaxID=1871046 RepID=UPI0030F0D867